MYEDDSSDEWSLIFYDIVLHQRELADKAFERYSFASSFLFPQDKLNAQLYMKGIEEGMDRFEYLVLDANRYIDFGSGKEVDIIGAHGKSSAIIHFLESTNRAITDFTRFLDDTTTPEAVQQRCDALPPDQCAAPCMIQRKGFFRRKSCGFE